MTTSPAGPSTHRSPLRRGARLLAALVATVLGTVLGTGLLAAPPTSAAPAPGDGALLVIMDVSGSMQRTDSGGSTLIDGARSAVTDLVRSVPDDARIGLRLYGDRYAGDVEARGCQDSRLVVPIGEAGRTGDRITSAIDGARPTGFTPIGYALTEAADDFAPEGERSIVLVSDGEDTCGDPAPCAAAKELAARGIDVRVDTVGLSLAEEPAARRQLECIAKATGGTYVPADDASELSEQLTQASTRALQRFQADGEKITGGPAETQATPIEANTAYTDDIVDGESRWYSIELQEGDRLSATITDDGDPEYGCCTFGEVYNPDGLRVGFDSGNSTGTATTLRMEGGSDGAAESGTYLVTVRLDVSSASTELGKPVDFQLQADVEAADPASATAEPSGPTGPSQATVTETVTASPEPAPAASQESATGASDEEGGGLLWGVTVVLGLLVVGLGAALLLLWRRLRAATGG